jgi:hypothetical protein
MWMLRSPDKVQSLDQEQHEECIDMLGACRSILRVLVHLENAEYTSDQWRQAEVVVHDDLPDPASDVSTSQG